jgi:hypothetical protein
MTAPVRPCLGCGQYDDGPRHLTAMPDGALVPYHMRCCAMSRDCEICDAQLADAPEGADHDQLREYLMTTGTTADRPGWTAPADEVPDQKTGDS